MGAEPRAQRICVNETEKEALAEIRQTVYGTDSVPLGETLRMLMSECDYI